MIERIKRSQPLVIAADRVPEMYALYQSGKSLKDVGRRFGISKQRVAQLFVQYDLQRRPPHYHIKSEEKEKNHGF